MTPLGANRKLPAARSSMAANTLGLSGSGTPAASIVLARGRGPRMVLMPPLHDRLGGVVVPAFELGPMQEPVDEHSLRDVQGDDEVDLAAQLQQHPVELLRLLGGPGKAVEQHTRPRVAAPQPALDYAVDQLVGDEVA